MIRLNNVFLILLCFVLFSPLWSSEANKLKLQIGTISPLRQDGFWADNSGLIEPILKRPEKILSFYYHSRAGKSSNSSMLHDSLTRDGNIVLSISWSAGEDWMNYIKGRFSDLYENSMVWVEDSSLSAEEKEPILSKFESMIDGMYDPGFLPELSQGLDELINGLNRVFPDKKIVIIIDSFSSMIYDALYKSKEIEFQKLQSFYHDFLINLSSKVCKIITFGKIPIGLTDFVKNYPNLIKNFSATSSSDFCQYFGLREDDVRILFENRKFNSSYECLVKACLAYSYKGINIFRTHSVLDYFSSGECNFNALRLNYEFRFVPEVLRQCKEAVEIILSLLENNDAPSLKREVCSMFEYKDDFFENLTPQEALALLINWGALYVEPDTQEQVKDSIYSVKIRPLNLEQKCFYLKILNRMMKKEGQEKFNFNSEINKIEVLSTLFPKRSLPDKDKKTEKIRKRTKQQVLEKDIGTDFIFSDERTSKEQCSKKCAIENNPYKPRPTYHAIATYGLTDECLRWLFNDGSGSRQPI